MKTKKSDVHTYSISGVDSLDNKKHYLFLERAENGGCPAVAQVYLGKDLESSIYQLRIIISKLENDMAWLVWKQTKQKTERKDNAKPKKNKKKTSKSGTGR